MKAHVILLCIAAATATPGGGLYAQAAESPCPEVYPAPQVGDYAELRFTNVEDESMTIRFAVVGTETVKGGTHYWIEVITIPPALGEPVIAKMLVPYYPFEFKDVKSYIVQMPGQPPRKAPQEMMEMLAGNAGPGPGWREQCTRAAELGLERVNVPAGSFLARHFRAQSEDEGEVWIADVPFGMIKLVQPDGSMELVTYGSDAKSAITEKPVEMELPPPDGP